ncbi:transposase IS116/IS110/IS902 family protein [Paenibacillus alvei TS-15]|uniref:Transposase IS116/IS110/IS902 family protein n=1 Tax=Paenibacillus alvei TS-15 TaxID=1117108 RepID=S9SQY2_PAEAL|nr:IS110 family transposase [Paenibacillus alvei]EPY08112.1 transposase IS116/IS110/IS902 family protein [Paenibacillus alvei TS-15]
MEPVIGMDVSKGSSVIQAFLGRNEPYGKAKQIYHNEQGFEWLSVLCAELKTRTGAEPVVIMEATGHYHRGVVCYLIQKDIRHIILNPLQSKRAKGMGLRKVKTDEADAWSLAEMFYRGDALPHRIWDESYMELQHATRQHEFVTSLYVQAKLNTRALLDQVIPAYEGVFSDLYSATSLQVLQSCLQGQMDKAEIIEKVLIKYAGRSRSQSWIREKSIRIEEILGKWKEERTSPSQTEALKGMITLLLTLQAQLKQLEQQMEEISVQLPEVDLLKSIPGIGEKLAAAIVAEIGDIKQFRHAKQLVAYAGLDPSVHSSGKFTASSNRITKRGSKRLRRSLYLAVQCGLRQGNNRRLASYYERKKKEGKPYKVTVIACANKLLHHIYAILNRGQPYQT